MLKRVLLQIAVIVTNVKQNKKHMQIDLKLLAGTIKTLKSNQ